MGFFRSDTRFTSDRVLAWRGAVFLVVVTLLVGVLALVGRGTFSDTIRATSAFDTVGGALVSGADVKYRGVIIGRITGLAAEGRPTSAAGRNGVRASLVLDRSAVREVPGNVVSRVLPASVFGTGFVDLVSASAPRGHLEPGQRIPQDRRKATLDMQRLLDGLDSVVKALGPAELSTVLNSIARSLDGRGERLGRTIVLVEHYLAKLNPRMPLVRADLSLLDTNLDLLRRYGPELFDATRDALVTARTLVEKQGQFHRTVVAAAGLSDQGNRLLSRNEKALVDSIVQTAVVVDALYDGRQGLRGGLLALLDLTRGFEAGLSSGRWMKVDADVRTQDLPKYTAGDCPTYSGWRGRGC
jgi:virulence factor Mce-like protein